MGYDKLAAEYSIPLSPLPTSTSPGGRLAEPIQCVLFDIYGTLFISGSGDIGLAKKTALETKKIEQLLQKFNIRKTPRDLVNKLYKAIEDEHRQLQNEGIDYPEIEIDQIWKQILEICLSGFCTQAPQISGFIRSSFFCHIKFGMPSPRWYLLKKQPVRSGQMDLTRLLHSMSAMTC